MDKSINFNILNWWKVNLAKYQVISIMACYILSISVSTVAFESVFSTKWRVLDQYKSSVKSKTAEVLIAFALSVLYSDKIGGLALSWKLVVVYERFIFFEKKNLFFLLALALEGRIRA